MDSQPSRLCNTIKFGHLFVRNFSHGASALVGLVQLPETMKVDDGDIFTAFLCSSGMLLSDQPYMPLDDAMMIHGVTDLMRQPIWPKANVRGGMAVRFIKALPDTREWVIYAVTDQPWMPDDVAGTGDVWLRISPRGMEVIEPLAQTQGEQPGQVLGEPVWPSVNGDAYSLPQVHECTWRPFARYHGHMADWGDGLLTLDQVCTAIRSDPEIADIIPALRPDHAYATYLAHMRRLGYSQPPGPVKAADHARRETVSMDVVAALAAA